MGSTAFFFALLIASGIGQQSTSSSTSDAASTDQTSTAQPAVNPEALPVDIDKIQRLIAQKPAIVLEPDFNSDTGLPTFRVSIQGEKLSIDEILGPDYLRGPVPAGAMSHQEFLNMVTPKDVWGYAPFSNSQAATVAITSLALQWALKLALAEYQEAKDDRAREAARREVQEALEALRKARLEAGLLPK
jgi:hypothetical protein